MADNDSDRAGDTNRRCSGLVALRVTSIIINILAKVTDNRGLRTSRACSRIN